MQHLKHIAYGLTVFVTVLAFMVSTSGFTYFEHDCKHHEVQGSLLAIDDCCAAEPVPVKEEAHDCCSVPKKEVSNTCETIPEDGTCCVTHLEYFKLATTFVQSQNEEVVADIPLLAPLFAVYQAEIEEYISNYPDRVPEIRKPPPLLYRLYHCQRTEPPIS